MRAFLIFGVLLLSLFLFSWRTKSVFIPLGSRLFEGFESAKVGDRQLVHSYSPDLRLVQLAEALFFDPISSQVVEFENAKQEMGFKIAVTRRDKEERITQPIASQTHGIQDSKTVRKPATESFVYVPKFPTSAHCRIAYIPYESSTVLLVDNKNTGRLTHLVIKESGEVNAISSSATALVGVPNASQDPSAVPPFGISQAYDPVVRLRNITKKVKYDFTNQVLVQGNSAVCVRSLITNDLSGKQSMCAKPNYEQLDPLTFHDVATNSKTFVTKLNQDIIVSVVQLNDDSKMTGVQSAYFKEGRIPTDVSGRKMEDANSGSAATETGTGATETKPPSAPDAATADKSSGADSAKSAEKPATPDSASTAAATAEGKSSEAGAPDLSAYVLKTQLLSPICPQCPDCILSPNCTSCGNKNGSASEPAAYAGSNLSGYGSQGEGFANYESATYRSLGKAWDQTSAVMGDVNAKFQTFGNSISAAATQARLPYIAPRGIFTKDTVVSTADGDAPEPQRAANRVFSDASISRSANPAKYTSHARNAGGAAKPPSTKGFAKRPPLPINSRQ